MQLEMSEFKLRSSRVRVPAVGACSKSAANILPSFERCTLTRASPRLRKIIASAAPRDLSRSAGEVIRKAHS